MLRDATRAATPDQRRQGLARLTDGYPQDGTDVRNFDAAAEGEQDAELRMRYLQYALGHAQESERADLESMIGDRLRWDPSPEVRAAARRAACGSGDELEEQIASCPSSAAGCDAVAKCLPLYGPRAIELVLPWSRTDDPTLARLAADVVCGAISAHYPNEWLVDTVRDDPGPWLGAALLIFAADPPGSDRGACMDALSERTGLPRSALAPAPCGDR